MTSDAAPAAIAPELAALAAALPSTVSRLNRRLRAESGVQEFSTTQGNIVRRLYSVGPATTSELARGEEMRPQSMAAALAPLERAGYVARRPDPADGRASVVFLTEHGQRQLLEGRDAKRGWLARRLDERLTAAEQSRLAEAVLLLDRLLDPDFSR